VPKHQLQTAQVIWLEYWEEACFFVFA